jgi:hypothetical protein
LGLGIRPRGPKIRATCDANFMHLFAGGGGTKRNKKQNKKAKGAMVSVRA